MQKSHLLCHTTSQKTLSEVLVDGDLVSTGGESQLISMYS